MNSSSNHSLGFGSNHSTASRDCKGRPRRRVPELEVSLWNETGLGPTAAEQRVIRVSQQLFFARRMDFLDALEGWACHERCHWIEEGRVEQIESQMESQFGFKPLKVDDETRWKAKVMRQDAEKEDSAEKDKQQLGVAVSILNKLSWTNIGKLTVKFSEAVTNTSGSSQLTTAHEDHSSHDELPDTDERLQRKLVRETMTLLLQKAMLEPHFSELYATFAANLTRVDQEFRIVLLDLCRVQFKETGKEMKAPEGALCPNEEQVYDESLQKLKKKSIGLMKFIGELYKRELIKATTMMGCLKRLMQPDDAEKIECFAQLMATIGARLESEIDGANGSSSVVNARDFDIMWRHVYSMAGRPFSLAGSVAPEVEIESVAPNVRIRFLMQDLIDLKDKNWESHQRHKEEKARTIEEIHKEVAMEKVPRSQLERVRSAPDRSKSLSFNKGHRRDRRRPQELDQSSIQSSTNAVPRSRVLTPPRAMRRTVSDSLGGLQYKKSPKRAQAEVLARPRLPPVGSAPGTEFPDPEKCKEKTKSILRDFFVGDDLSEAIFSIKEIVGGGTEGCISRGAAVVESGILMVMEMKEENVAKFKTIVERCLSEKVLDHSSIARGLREPIAFLRDIEIDAPRAGDFLADMIAAWTVVSEGHPLSLKSIMLRQSELPERAAEFSAQVLALRGVAVSDDDVELIQALFKKNGKHVEMSPKDILELVKDNTK